MKRIARLIAATALLALSQPAGSQRLVEDQNVFKDITIRADVRNTRYLIPSPAGKLRKAGKPVAFFCGDSTMRNGSKGDGGIQGQWGWGLFAQEWFNADELVCENHGMGGMSSRTYYTSNLWQNVKNALQPGDYVIISFGHNDEHRRNIGHGDAHGDKERWHHRDGVYLRAVPTLLHRRDPRKGGHPHPVLTHASLWVHQRQA